MPGVRARNPTTKTSILGNTYVRGGSRMPALSKAFIAIVLLIGAAGGALAQGNDAAYEKLGKVHFENSCASSTGAEFDRAIALLHSFEFAPAIAGFQRVLKADPSCGIAEWG